MLVDLDPPPRRAWTEEERRSDAALLLDDPTFLTVELLDDDDEEMPPGWDWSPHAITFADVAGHVFSDLVEGTLAVARAFPGVTDVLREDTEVIMLKGRFDPEGLEAHLRQWWTLKLTEILGQ